MNYALRNDALILFDAAYEAYIQSDEIPHSIYEIRGARRCAIEFQLLEDGRIHGCPLRIHRCAQGPDRCHADRLPPYFPEPLWYRRQCTKFNGTSYISPTGGRGHLHTRGKEQVKTTIDYYMQNAHKMLTTLRGLGFECYGGENAPYIWMRTPDNSDSWRFFENLLYGANVVCTPGVGFGPAGEGYVRFTAFGSHENTDKALERITAWSKRK